MLFTQFANISTNFRLFVITKTCSHYNAPLIA
nr:MAG TPA: hypothetical protein [Caudoviricetes sp.]